jgi:cytidine deaminase
MAEIDWDALTAAARDVMTSAYAPYSRYPVGAAGLVEDGAVVVGCNVENVSYGLTLCAECGLVSALHATGGGRLIAVAVVDGNGSVTTPCGRCRQLLFEHGGDELLVLLPDGAHHLAELLPGAFGPTHLYGPNVPT